MVASVNCFRLVDLGRNLNKADSEALKRCAYHLKQMKKVFVNSLSVNPTKCLNTQQFVGCWPTNCLSVLDHFVGLARNGVALIQR